jgi:hypothetical protein
VIRFINKANPKRIKLLIATLATSLVVFLACRYVGDIISIIYALSGADISHIVGQKLDMIYSYRYSAPAGLFIVLLAVSYVRDKVHILKRIYAAGMANLKLFVANFPTIMSRRTKSLFEEGSFYLRREKWYFAILILIIFFCAVNNYIVIKEDTMPSMSDASVYFSASLDYYSVIAGLKVTNMLATIKTLLNSQPFHPPLIILTSLLFYYCFGKSTDTAAMSNIIYIAILIFSVYGIGKYFYSRKVGILAAFITATVPGIFALSRNYGPDVPLAAMTALSFYTFLLSNKFESRKYSFLFGVAIGLCSITKVTFILFIAATIGAYVLINWKDCRKTCKPKHIKNIMFAFIICLIIALPWYASTAPYRFSESLHILKGTSSEATAIPSQEILSDLFEYGVSCPIRLSLSHLYAFALLLSIGSMLLRKKDKPDIVLLGWIFVPYFVWLYASIPPTTLTHVYRYILPSMPGAALLISSSVFKLRIKSKSQSLIASLVVVGGLLGYLLISYPITTAGINIHPSWPGMYAAQKDYFHFEGIVNSIKPLDNNTKPKVLFISNIIYLSPMFEYMAKLNGNPFQRIDPIGYAFIFKNIAKSDNYTEDFILQADYILVGENSRPDLWGDSELWGDSALLYTELTKAFKESRDRFKLVKMLHVAENATLSLYQRIE